MKDSSSTPPGEDKDILVWAFRDAPVRIVWIERSGKVLKEETLTFVQSESGRMLPPGFVQQLRAMKRSMEGAELFGYCDEIDRLLAMLGEGKHG